MRSIFFIFLLTVSMVLRWSFSASPFSFFFTALPVCIMLYWFFHLPWWARLAVAGAAGFFTQVFSLLVGGILLLNYAILAVLFGFFNSFFLSGTSWIKKAIVVIILLGISRALTPLLTWMIAR